MKRFKNILLITNKNDTNSTDIKRAVSLARSNEAKLTIADTLPDQSLLLLQRTPFPRIESVLSDLAEKRFNELRLMANELSDTMDITPLVLQGTPYLEIITTVMQQKFDMLIKISEPEKSFTAQIFGSTDFRLLRKCPCPVWLLKPDTHLSFRSILAAVALETLDEEEDIDAMNKQILEMATSLAQEELSELHIVHAYTIFGEDFLTIPMAEYIAGDEIREWKISQRQDIEERFNHVAELLKKHLKDNNMEELTPQFHLVEGNTQEVIQRMINDNKVDLVVMGTVARSNLTGLLMGNTAESILNRISCSVLTVKPSSFTSPVKLDS
ncbi:MAG: universal stress protein [Desulfobulbaceae bacterium]|nr:universal stress protein [Desulfobulbaceae bacterium]